MAQITPPLVPSKPSLTNGLNRLVGSTSRPACPLCQRPFADQRQAERVHARREAQERLIAEKYRRQFDHDRLQLQTLARNEGVEIGKAATQERIDLLAAEKDATRLQVGMEDKCTAIRNDARRLARELIQLREAREDIDDVIMLLRKLQLRPMSYVLSLVPGTTIADRCRRLRITRQTYYYWMNGKYRPAAEQAEMLAKLTGIPIEEIRAE